MYYYCLHIQSTCYYASLLLFWRWSTHSTPQCSHHNFATVARLSSWLGRLSSWLGSPLHRPHDHLSHWFYLFNGPMSPSATVFYLFIGPTSPSATGSTSSMALRLLQPLVLPLHRPYNFFSHWFYTFIGRTTTSATGSTS